MMLAIKKALVEKGDLVETMVYIGQQYPFCGYGAKFFSCLIAIVMPDICIVWVRSAMLRIFKFPDAE